ncbi:MAG: ATP-binding protein, partial [Pseudohongiellaceae bacterium]
LAGVSLWFLFLMLPLTTEPAMVSSVQLNWAGVAALSLLANSMLFVLVSVFTSTSIEEKNSAEVCAINSSRRLRQSGLLAKSPSEFISRLSKPLGIKAANREVTQALKELNIAEDEKRPHALRMLRGRLEANLSGLLGPNIAHEMVNNFLPYRVVSERGIADVNLIENRIEAYQRNLSGMAADLDNIRRYHRQILLDLPLGVCSLGVDNEIAVWNYTLERLTGIAARDVLGLQLTELPEPWQSLMYNFVKGSSGHLYKQTFQLQGNKRAVNLHKAVIENADTQSGPHYGVTILLEDMTETELLEEGLTHSERLASIGRLAAGVAHEIGNPITGIACLAQNIRDEYSDRELRAMAEQIIEQTNRTSRIVQSLVNFAHAGTNKTHYESEPVCVRDCIDEAITLVSLDKKGRSINYVVECEPDCKILGDTQRLLQVLLNLISNARDASQPESSIHFACRRNLDLVEITVTDEGIGIAPAIRDRIFDPFFTTKEAGEGTGLGLSLVFSIVEDLNGSIDIISPADTLRGVGTRVVLSFSGIIEKNNLRDQEDNLSITG